MPVTTLGKRSRTTPTISSSAGALEAVGALAAGRPVPTGAACPGDSVAGEVRYVAVAPPEIPPMRIPTRRRAAARPRLTRSRLSAQNPRCFGVRAGRGLAAPGGRTHGVGFDHLTDRRRTHLEIHVRVRLDRHVPARRDLELLVDALESLLGVGDRVDRPRPPLARGMDSNCVVQVPAFGANGDFSHLTAQVWVHG